GLLRELRLQLLDLSPTLADDDAGPRRPDRHTQLVAGAIHFNRADTGRLQPFMQRLLQFQVLAQQLRIVLLGEPARAPSLSYAKPESVRMYLLSHSLLLAPPLL